MSKQLISLLFTTAALVAQNPCFNANYGVALGAGDDTVFASQALGFAFPIGGATYTDVHISTNGLIYLSNGGTPAPGGSGCCAGTTAALVAGGPIVAPFWTDLNVIAANGAAVYFNTNAAFATITWHKAIEYAATPAVEFDMQCQLWLNGDIRFSYGPGMTLVTAGDALVGMSPGTGSVVPAASDFSTPSASVDNTNYELFNNTALPFDLANNTLFLSATNPGYAWVAVPITGCAATSIYGTGCVTAADTSSYEYFATSAAFDLASSSLSLLNTGGTYLAMGSLATFVPPSGAATSLTLTDDSETTVALSAPLRVARTGSTNSLTICSNGFVSVASGNGTGFTPTVATMLNNTRTGWYCWHDYNPTLAGSGTVKFEEVNGVAYVTWDGVYDYGGTSAANANTWQIQFELATGNVHFVWQTMSGLGNGHLVGFSEGGVSADPGSMDISAALPATYIAATFAVQPLMTALDAAPVHGSTVNFVTTELPSQTIFGGIAIGFANPALDLTPYGMPGCTQYTDSLGVILFFPNGSNTANLPFGITPNTAYTGVTMLAQAMAYCPAAGLNALGAIASNGVTLVLGQ